MKTAFKRRRMMELRKRSVPGTAPGVLSTPHDALAPTLRIFAYNAQEFTEATITSLDEVPALQEKWPVVWLDIDGLGDVELIRQLGEKYELHPLALEDTLSPHQRPKVEDYDAHLYMVARMPHLDRVAFAVDLEQISFFLKKGLIISVQERPGDCFDPVRERLRHGKGRIRTAGADYLAYALTDAIVDHYFPVIEGVSDILDVVEDKVLTRAETSTLQEIHRLKQELMGIRRAMWPQRDALGSLVREHHKLIGEANRSYWRDCYDHVIQIIDILESERERASALTDLYLSSVSNRMNEVMKVLTVVATIFMPLGFITGLYGMNFDRSVSRWNMPELGWTYGYFFALGMMLLMAGLMVGYFYWKGWIGPREK